MTTKEKAAGGVQATAATLEVDTSIIGPLADARKRLANLKARAALAGVAVHTLDDGTFLACRWNLTRELPTLDALELWLNTMGVRNARS